MVTVLFISVWPISQSFGLIEMDNRIFFIFHAPFFTQPLKAPALSVTLRYMFFTPTKVALKAMFHVIVKVMPEPDAELLEQSSLALDLLP